MALRRLARRSPAISWRAEPVLLVVGCAAFALVVFGPLVALAFDTLRYIADGHADALALVVPYGRRFPLIARSIWLAASIATAAMAIGTLVATVLTRWRTGSASYARWLVLALAPVPAYVHALAWSSTALRANTWLASLGLPEIPSQGLAASWWVETMAALPLAVGLALVALESVPSELTAAGRVQRSDIATLARITLPLARPMVLAGGGLVLVLSLLDYSVPALFQVNVYSLAIFADFSASSDPQRALLMALPLLVVSAALITLSQSGLRHAARRRPRRRAAAGAPPRFPAWFVVLQAVACALLAAQVVVPLVVLARSVGSVQQMVATTSAATSEIGFTLRTGLLTAFLCLPLALPASRPLLRRDAVGRAWWLAVTGPLAIPAPLVGIGLIALWNRPLVAGLYGTTAMPLMAMLARFAPLAVIMAFIQARQIDPELVDASRLHQATPLHGWTRVRLPMLAAGLLAGACVAFALSLGELGATLIALPPGHSTISLRIYNYLHYGASDTVAGLCLLLAATAIVAGILGLAGFSAWGRLTSGTPQPDVSATP